MLYRDKCWIALPSVESTPIFHIPSLKSTTHGNPSCSIAPDLCYGSKTAITFADIKPKKAVWMGQSSPRVKKETRGSDGLFETLLPVQCRKVFPKPSRQKNVIEFFKEILCWIGGLHLSILESNIVIRATINRTATCATLQYSEDFPALRHKKRPSGIPRLLSSKKTGGGQPKRKHLFS